MRHLIGPVLIAFLAATSGQGDDAAPPAKPVFSEVAASGSVQFEPTPLEEQSPAHFRLQPHAFDYEARAARMLGPVRMLKVTYPSPVETAIRENNTVHAEYFQPTGPGPFPACVVLHILGGDFLLAETVAQHLARNGVAAMFVKMPYYGERRGKDSTRRMISRVPSESVEGMTQAVLDIRRATAWLAQRPEVDASRLGITGISLGGIMSALAASGEPRLGSVAVFLGGGGLADILWANDTREAQAFREQWIADGGTAETFRRTLAPVDPATHGHLLKGRRVLMIAAKNDEVVPPDSARALWDSIGREPELVWIDAGHYSAIRYLPRELVRIDRFFNARE